MARSLLGQILERMPDYSIDLSQVEPYPHQGTNTGFQRIRARFTPGPRRLPVMGASEPAHSARAG